MARKGRVSPLDHSWVAAAFAAGATQRRGPLQQILEPAFAQPGASGSDRRKRAAERGCELLELVTKLGHAVKIVIGPVRRRPGRIELQFA